MGTCCQKTRHNIKQFILRTDMFSANACFRIKGQPQYESLLGGILSMILIAFFIAVFAQNFLSILQYHELSAVTQQTQNLNPETSMDDLQFAFNIQNIDLRKSGANHFEFGLISRVFINYVQDPTRAKTYRLQPCDRAQWADLGGKVPLLFDIYKMKNMLCLPKGQSISIYGHKSAQNYSYLQLTIGKCVNSTFKTCDTPLNILNTLNSVLATQNYLTVKLLILNTMISADKPNPVTQTLQDEIWFTFTTTLGTKGTAYFGRYTIQTDESYWPWNSYTELQGNYITKYQTKSYQVKHNTYAIFQFVRQTTQLSITRTYGKLDEMLSYIGGLFGLLFAFFFFFLQAYNQYCYQLTIGQSLFQSQQGMKQSNFNIFHYIGYQIYQYALILGCDLNWTRMKQIHVARSQAVQQLDARLVMKKLIYFEKVVDILLDQHQKIAIYLTDPPTIQQVSKIRKINQVSYDLLNKLKKGNYQFSNKIQNEYEQNTNNEHNIKRGSSVHRIFPFQSQEKVEQQPQKKSYQQFDIISDNNEQKQVRQALRNSLKKTLENRKTNIDKKIAQKISIGVKKQLQQTILRMGMMDQLNSNDTTNHQIPQSIDQFKNNSRNGKY